MPFRRYYVLFFLGIIRMYNPRKFYMLVEDINSLI